MLFQTFKNIIAEKEKYALLKSMTFMNPVGRLIFYNAALESGLLKVMIRPVTVEQIAGDLKIQNRQLLSSLLDLGCVLKELSCKNGQYRITGKMSKALLRYTPVAELIRETVQYHADVALRLSSYLLENRRGDYLPEMGGIIAESSRIGEFLIKAFIYHTVKKSETLNILEFGCGSGEYLKYYVDINKNNHGIAIDKDASAVAIAGENIKRNNIEKNFTVLQDNIMTPSSLEINSFDLVTSHSNIYYFSDDDRNRLFTSIHNLLKKDGRFMLATMLKSKKITSAYYDIIFSATEGLYPLPVIDDIVRDLKNAGFKKVKVVNILDESFKGIVAFK